VMHTPVPEATVHEDGQLRSRKCNVDGPPRRRRYRVVNSEPQALRMQCTTKGEFPRIVTARQAAHSLRDRDRRGARMIWNMLRNRPRLKRILGRRVMRRSVARPVTRALLSVHGGRPHEPDRCLVEPTRGLGRSPARLLADAKRPRPSAPAMTRPDGALSCQRVETKVSIEGYRTRRGRSVRGERYNSRHDSIQPEERGSTEVTFGPNRTWLSLR
jgi:hypothetical protein